MQCSMVCVGRHRYTTLNELCRITSTLCNKNAKKVVAAYLSIYTYIFCVMKFVVLIVVRGISRFYQSGARLPYMVNQ